MCSGTVLKGRWKTMNKEIQIIRYLLDEIEERESEIKEFDELDADTYKKKYGHTQYYIARPQKQLIVDNAKKIRQLALKIGKQV